MTTLLARRPHPLIVLSRNAFDPTKHERVPKGQPGGGRFMKMVDRLQAAIREHQASGAEGHPFDGFSREQLRRVAKERGIPLTRGEDQDSIGRKLMASLGHGTGEGHKVPQPTPAKPPTVAPKPEPAEHAAEGWKPPKPLSAAAASAMQKEMLAKNPWTPEQKAALVRYGALHYADVNRVLRGFAKPEDIPPAGFEGIPIEDTIRDATAAMRPMTQDALLLRRVGFEALGVDNAEEAKGLVGKTLREPAFMSTTIARRRDLDKAVDPGQPVVMEIDAPAGTHGAYLGDLATWKHQREMLLAPGTRYHVMGVEEKGGLTTVRVKVVHGESVAKAAPLTGEKALNAAPIKMGKVDFERGVHGDLAHELDAEALNMYRAHEFDVINSHLRGHLDNPDSEWTVKAIDAVMEHSPLTHDVTVYRGVANLDMFQDVDTKKSLVGLEYAEDAYSSTTADKAVADEFNRDGALLRLRVPAGVGAVQLSDMGPPPRHADPILYEAELLLQRGLRVRIVGDQTVNGVRQLDAEVVPV